LRFVPAPLEGVFVIEPEFLEDERGFFARSFCQDQFRAHGLDPVVAQCNISFNRQCGTLRGLHYQAPPHEEAKLVRCTRGAIWDAVVDLRDSSVTRYRWFAVELTSESRRALYVPAGFAHGFQTLANDSEVLYQMSGSFHPESARGLRWDDPAFGIAWPIRNPVLSLKDRSYPFLERAAM
jgi:dTDP-4-dehydrorhamnose 3,5-epimerase